MANKKLDWDRVHRQNYLSRAFGYIHWISKAKELLQSAKLIEPEVVRLWSNYRANLDGENNELLPDYYQSTYFMLIAYAVENLLKAAIIREKSFEYKREFSETLRFPKELQSHDLVELARKANLNISREEEDLLRRLTRSAIWYGRYPVPLDYKDISGVDIFSDGKKYFVSWFGGNDLERINKFIESLKDRLNIPAILGEK